MLASSGNGALLPSKKACERCTSDKKKCDGHRPCKRCVVKRWTDQCVYVRSKKRGPPSKRALDEDLAKEKRKRQDDGQVDNGAENAVVPDPHLDEELAHEIAAIYHGILHLHNPVLEIGALSSIRAMEKCDEIAYRAAMGAAASLYACLSGPSKAKKEKALAYFCHTAQELGREIVQLQQRIDDEEHLVAGRDGLRAAQLNLVRYQLAVGMLNFGLLKFELGWRRLGNAIRLLQFLQLHTKRHTDAQQTPGSSLILSPGSGAGPSTIPSAAVARQQQEYSRLFWQAYILDQITSVTLQRPPILRAAECDAPFPETDSVEEHKLWLTDLTRDLVNLKHQASLDGVKCHLNTSMRCWASLMTIHEKLHHYHLQPLQSAAASDNQSELPADHTTSSELARHLARAGQALQKWKDGLPAPVAWQSPLLLPWDTVLPLLSSNTSPQGAPPPPPPPDARTNGAWSEGTAGSAQEDDLTPYFEAAIARHYGVSPQILTVRVWYCACMILFYRTHARFLMDGLSSTTGHCTFARLPFAFVQRAAMELCAILTSFDDVFSIRLSPVIQTHAIFQAAVIHAMAFSAWQREALSPVPVHPVLTRSSVEHSQMLLRRCKTWLDSMGLQSRRVPARHSLILSKLDSTFGSRDDDRLARLPIDDSSIDDEYPKRDTEGQGRASTLPSFSDDETPSSRALHSTSSLQDPSGQHAPQGSALDQQWQEWFRSLKPSDTTEYPTLQVAPQAPSVADFNPPPLAGGQAPRENETTLTPAALFDSAWSQLPYSSNDFDEWMSFLERMPR
ncbi:hypothetical protein FA10DRAFT_269247 [Acaromyces ingoldii]|uniref:Zn(2)-C6 fungal-type domain-containing protein n=1 Tax=Acaromyces ingoldii TaxID=215250 RepID=A0A316YGM3_9BASI|nr:hypothetical protein FA10DRAFT_269247 [Acaromyces ingoldii]PWN87994.1 hypothetical protein FA10DRAFT_269247 [Acaromyces ingoldii]